jgi:hypothetical protein
MVSGCDSQMRIIGGDSKKSIILRCEWIPFQTGICQSTPKRGVEDAEGLQVVSASHVVLALDLAAGSRYIIGHKCVSVP